VSTHPKLLLVDDVEANLIALRAVLEDLPCELLIARSGNEALSLLLKHSFVAMLLDVQMPDMDGYETARHARNHPSTCDVPIIFLTAKHETQDEILRGYGTGAVDYLFKPISPIVLRSKIRVFLELHEDRRKVEEALLDLKRTQSQLVQSAKMASLGELVAGVAHEINNPLAFVVSHLRTAMQGFDSLSEGVSSLLGTEADKATWTKSLLRLKQSEVGLGRISELVGQLRTFSRLDEGELKTIDIQESIDSVLMILGHRLGEQIQVQVEVAEPRRVECYPGPLNVAIMNLVANAIDAITGRGNIVLTTRYTEAGFELEVIDDGQGIPDAIQDRIFEPFFTTKPVGQGTGLGLSITYSIAKKHGGSLLVASRPGKTSFRLSFPHSIPS
jgi:two-component system, NtrC family, sensor kinase